eukprot:6220149-Amphidinium_carterae.2
MQKLVYGQPCSRTLVQLLASSLLAAGEQFCCGAAACACHPMMMVCVCVCARVGMSCICYIKAACGPPNPCGA